MSHNIPEFFIVGAPKCGTSSLFRALEEHPEIFVSTPKEPKFFCPDFWGKNHGYKDMEAYLSLFKDSNGKVCGEGTTLYLYSEEAAQKIYDFNPKAKIIILLRNPVDFLYSYHSQLLRNCTEVVTNFSQALEMEKLRKDGKKIPSTCQFPRQLYYSEVAKFSIQVRRYLELFGDNQVKIILFDDLKQDISSVYRETLDFLGVDADFRASFKVYQANKKIKIQKLYMLINSPPKAILNFSKAITPSFLHPLKKNLGNKLRSLSRRLLMQEKSRKSLSKSLRENLIEQYSQEISELTSIIKRDLSRWLA